VKNYTRANNIDYLIGKGLRPVFYYDDFELYLGAVYDDIPESYRYIVVPGRVEAESFHSMKGIHLRSTTDVDGEIDADSIGTGDWLAYQVNTPAEGPYAFSWRMTAGSPGAGFDFYSGDSLLATVSVPVETEPFDWVTVTDTLVLPAGNQTLRIVSTSGEWIFNWFSLEQLGVPQVMAIPERDTLCNGDTTSILLEGGTGLDQEVVFQYNSEASGTLSGNGSGELQPGEMISDIITNGGDTYGIVEYAITPYSLAENGEPLYAGENVTARVWVEPDPFLQSISLKDTVDSGGTTMLCLRSSTTTTSGVQIGYQSAAAGGHINGHGNGFLEPGQCISELLDNQSSERGYVTYTMVPYTLDPIGNRTCHGIPVSDTVWVRPAWAVSASGRVTDPGTHLQIYPNPAGETLFLSRSTAYEVFTSCGVKMVAGRCEQIDLEGLPPGIYYLKASGTIQKFVKE
jgi:hypothetical protein